MSSGTSDIPGGVTGAIPNVGSNSYGFNTGSAADSTSGLNSLSGPLMGANAGTLPNGLATAGGASSNFLPQGAGTGGGSGLSAGSLNGNTSFGMPNSSLAQLNSQSLNKAGGAAMLGAGTKLATAPSSSAPSAGRAANVTAPATSFSAPMTNFAGSAAGSPQGQNLLSMLSKYRPGTAL